MSPSTAKCKSSGCNHLQGVTIDTVNGPRVNWYCGLTNRIPGNMGKCPLVDDA
ncbi:hypothetical protein V7O66_13870 [Methanolobus sp. ZRKC3]|uniref:hypothetical protein n=1 Tax=Methanolobus sp. ZRKC3 TaxID=3125786 RepID=UPI00324B1255